MRKAKACFILTALLLQVSFVYAQSETSFWDSLEQSTHRPLPDSSTVLHLNWLSTYYASKGEKDPLVFAERALHLADSLGFERGVTLSTLSLAMAHDMQGQYYLALKHYRTAIQLAREQNNDDYLARCYLSLGYYYSTQKNYKLAIEYTREAAEIEQKLFGINGAPVSWSNLGYYYLKQQQYDSARFFTLKSFEIYKAEKDSAGLGDVFYNLGSIAWESGRNASLALKYSLQARDMYLSSPYTEMETLQECQAQIGYLYTQLQDYTMADIFLHSTLEQAQKNNLRTIVKSCYRYLSERYAAVKDYEQAYRYHQLFYQLHDSLYNQQSSLSLQQLQNEFELETQEAKLSLMKKDKIIKEEELTRQVLIRNGLTGMFFGLLIFAAVLYRNNSQKRKINELLLKQKEEIEEKNKAIVRKNGKLEEQKKAMFIQSRSLKLANEQISKQSRTIEQKNKDTEDSLLYARNIQYAMLPQAEQLKNRVTDAFTWLQPRDIVSGDFFWFEEQDGKLFIAAIDCTGHGVPGAFMSLIGDGYLGQIVKLEGIHEPDRILSRLDSYVRQVLNQETTENNDGMEVALCVIDPEKKELRFAGARNHLFYVQNERLHKIKGDRLHIGGQQPEPDKKFTSHTIHFNRPTRIYLYTDGIRDQFGGENDKKFGEKQLNDFLLRIHDLPMSRQRMLIKEKLEKWMQGYEQLDDILILGWSLP